MPAERRQVGGRLPETTRIHGATALLSLGAGVFFLVGACQSFGSGHWPAFMPPQLDLFVAPFSWLSEQLGAAVGGVLAGIVGLLCLFAGVDFLARGKASPAPSIEATAPGKSTAASPVER